MTTTTVPARTVANTGNGRYGHGGNALPTPVTEATATVATATLLPRMLATVSLQVFATQATVDTAMVATRTQQDTPQNGVAHALTID
jgi:hypothetical protein